MYVWDTRSHTDDPRLEWDPEAAIDTVFWQTVLEIAERHCRKTCYVLWFFRRLGARLIIHNNKLRIIPVFSENLDASEWKTKEEYERDRQKILLPCVDLVKKIFEEAYEKIQKSV